MPNSECGHDERYTHLDGETGCLLCRWKEAEKAAEENRVYRLIVEQAAKEWMGRNVPVLQ